MSSELTLVAKAYVRLHSRETIFPTTASSSSTTASQNAVPIAACATCHKSQNEFSKPLKRCAKCHTTTYCTSTCQKQDWPKHKRTCRPNQKSLPSVSTEAESSTSSPSTIEAILPQPPPGVPYPAAAIPPVTLEQILTLWEILRTEDTAHELDELPHQALHDQIIDLSSQINSPRFPDLSLTNPIALAIGVYPNDTSAKFHDFVYEMCLAYELSLRLTKTGWYFLTVGRKEDTMIHCITDKVIAAILLSQEWILNITATPPPAAFPTSGYILRSSSFEKKVEGLFEFARVLQWPFLNELETWRQSPSVLFPHSLRNWGVGPQLYEWDWMFGLSLPGKDFAEKIMLVLVLACESTQHLGEKVASIECMGLLLGRHSYWRQSSTIGKVMGGLKNSRAVSGWIGPCVSTEGKTIAGFVTIPDGDLPSLPKFDSLGKGFVNTNPDLGGLDIAPGESVDDYFNDLEKWTSYVVPELPEPSSATCKLLHISFSAPSPAGSLKGGHISTHTNIVFEVNKEQVTYKINSNPVFVSAIPCFHGPHTIHIRQITDHNNFWEIDSLKAAPNPFEQDVVMIINATCGDSEVLARAWCAERMVHAVIRREGVNEACLTCAVRMASNASLGVGVLIWS